MGFHKTCTIPAVSLCLMLVDQDVSPQYSSASCLPAHLPPCPRSALLGKLYKLEWLTMRTTGFTEKSGAPALTSAPHHWYHPGSPTLLWPALPHFHSHHPHSAQNTPSLHKSSHPFPDAPGLYSRPDSQLSYPYSCPIPEGGSWEGGGCYGTCSPWHHQPGPGRWAEEGQLPGPLAKKVPIFQMWTPEGSSLPY